MLITPTTVTLERALQFIKGGFSYRAKDELGSGGEIWQTSFHEHRVRDAAEYGHFRDYIHQNPVRRHLYHLPEEYVFGSVIGKYELDPVPQRLKPISMKAATQA